MKMILLIFIVTIFGCKCSKTAAAKEINVPDNINKVGVSKTANDSLVLLPNCMKALVEKMKSEVVTNPPSKLYSYTYNKKTVYYVPPVCCDNFSDLYDDSCKIIAHPDGGFTGRGDGKIPNFEKEKSNEKLIWEDKRKQ